MTRRSGRYEEAQQGEWFEPLHRGYLLACCDCALVHRVDFRIAYTKTRRPKIQMRVHRHERATAAMRRPFKFAKDDE